MSELLLSGDVLQAPQVDIVQPLNEVFYACSPAGQDRAEWSYD